MKRLALFIVLGVILVHVASRRHHRPAMVPDGVPPGESYVRLASWDGGPPPPPPKAPRKAATKTKPAPPAPPAAPQAPIDPKRPPEWWPRDRDEEEAHAKAPDSRGARVLVGQLSATEDKARKDLRIKVGAAVTEWLSGDVPRSWTAPDREIDAMTGTAYVQPVAESLGDSSKDIDEIYTLYRAGARVDFSPARKARLVGLYNDQLVRERMINGGGVLGFALIALAAIAGYIRADEATKGYYTNRLRMLAAAGVGAAGVVIYKALA
jgi:hypothetical protein